MSYEEFLDNIDNYIGKIAQFEIRFKADCKVMKSERVIECAVKPLASAMGI